MLAHLIPVLEIGGTHVSAGLVDPDKGTVIGPVHRLDLNSAGSAAEILEIVLDAAGAVSVPPASTWGVAVPDPFDYDGGIALFEGVGKFESLHGLNLRAVLTSRLPAAAARVVFLNDADAFALGEWGYGAAAGFRRCLGLTLGTGIGTGWIVDGRIVGSGPGIPPDGRAHRLQISGAPLEETVSSRAIRRAYRAATGGAAVDVREIAELARGGAPVARRVLRQSMRALGAALTPCLRDFGVDIVVVGGSMAASWDLFEPWWRSGLAEGPPPPPIRLATNADLAPLLGAARFARDATFRTPRR